MEHDPWNFADKIENCFVNGGRASKRYTDHICQKISAYFSELLFSPQRPRRINRHHLQGLLRLKSRKLFMKGSHFREQAQIIVARETVRAQTNVESKSLQPRELEIAVPKVGVAARTMRD